MQKLIYFSLLFFLITFLNFAQDLIFQSSDLQTSVWPISGSNSLQDSLSYGYGPRLLNGEYDFHRGIDIPCPAGTPVLASIKGIVVRVRKFIESGPDSSTVLRRFGNFMVVAHQSLITIKGKIIPRQTAYLHLNGFNKNVGDTVFEGDVIGFAGKTGENIFTDHLHFEYYVGRNDGLITSIYTRNPFRILNYDKKNPAVKIEHSESKLLITIANKKKSLDLTRIRLSTNTGVSKIIDFETREGINVSDEDDNNYEGVLTSPENFNEESDSSILHLEYDNVINFGNSWTNVDNFTITIYNAQDDSADYNFCTTAHKEKTSFLPAGYKLSQNFPNPFNPKTTISFMLPRKENVKIEVFDISGNKIIELLNSEIAEGEHHLVFDSRSKEGGDLASGTYFYTMKTPNYFQAGKCLLVK